MNAIRSLAFLLGTLLLAACAGVPDSTQPKANPAPIATGTLEPSPIVRAYADKKFGTTMTFEGATTRRAIIASFVRKSGWGEVRFLLCEAPQPGRLSAVALTEASFGNARNQELLPGDRELLFSDRTFAEMKKWPVGPTGSMLSADIFAAKQRDGDIWHRMLPVIARICLTDDPSYGRDREWKESWFHFQAVTVTDYVFNHNKGGKGGYFVASVFTDDIDLPIGRAITDEMFVD